MFIVADFLSTSFKFFVLLSCCLMHIPVISFHPNKNCLSNLIYYVYLQAEQLKFPLERPVLKLHTTEEQARVIKVTLYNLYC